MKTFEEIGFRLFVSFTAAAVLLACGVDSSAPGLVEFDSGSNPMRDAATDGDSNGADGADGSSASADAETSEDLGDGDPDTPPDSSGPVIVYMAPDGDDSRDGASEESAIQTTSRAHEIVQTLGARDVEIRIGLGTYYAQTVVWTETRPDNTITFTRWPADGPGRPVFDGCEGPDGPCPGGTWFRLRHSAGEETNLNFNYVRVENYGTAISLDGARNDEATSNGSNRIYGCYFENIGNVFNPSLDPSTAAVRLVNSDDNVIANNHFVNVVNTTSGGLIHAIYAAHMSDRNTIRANRFKVSSGDPVRIRDYSNDNVIIDNRFIQVGTQAGYTDWYCDHDVRDDCTKVGPECPSWGNAFRDNLLDGKYDCTVLGTFHYFQDDSTTGCSPPSADARRLRTSGNTQNSPPCTSE